MFSNYDPRHIAAEAETRATKAIESERLSREECSQLRGQLSAARDQLQELRAAAAALQRRAGDRAAAEMLLARYTCHILSSVRFSLTFLPHMSAPTERTLNEGVS